MNIVHDYPPNIEDIRKVFDLRNRPTVIFTYGDTVYKPGGKGSIPEHLKIHERTHTRQQGDDPAAWWRKYLSDPAFRLDQELEAYRRQYNHIKNTNHNLREQTSFLIGIAEDLASEIYGNIITKEEAIRLIKNE